MTIWRWEDISRHDTEPYLVRLTVFKCWLFAIFLHWFVGSDDECMHDHPWHFCSVVLRGGYQEETPAGSRWYGRGSVLLRRAGHVHRVVVEGPGTVTLVLATWKVRLWGFHTPGGWVPFHSYSYKEHCP